MPVALACGKVIRRGACNPHAACDWRRGEAEVYVALTQWGCSPTKGF